MQPSVKHAIRSKTGPWSNAQLPMTDSCQPKPLGPQGTSGSGLACNQSLANSCGVQLKLHKHANAAAQGLSRTNKTPEAKVAIQHKRGDTINSTAEEQSQTKEACRGGTNPGRRQPKHQPAQNETRSQRGLS